MSNTFEYNLRGAQIQLLTLQHETINYYACFIDLPSGGNYGFGPITNGPKIDSSLYCNYIGSDPFPVPQSGSPVAITTYYVGLYTAQNYFTAGEVPSGINLLSNDGITTMVTGNPNSYRPPLVKLGDISLTNLQSQALAMQSGTNPYNYFVLLLSNAASRISNQFAGMRLESFPVQGGNGSNINLIGTLSSNPTKTDPVCVAGCYSLVLPPDLNMSGFPLLACAQIPEGEMGPPFTINYSSLFQLSVPATNS